MLHDKELSESALDALIADERARVIAPLTEWQSLSVQLQEEGLMRTAMVPALPFNVSSPRARSFTSTVVPQRRMNFVGWGVRAFASVLLVGAGVFAGQNLMPKLGGNGGNTEVASQADLVAPANVIQASNNATSASYDFKTPEQALTVIKRAQMEYIMAAAYLAAHDESGNPVTSLTRLQERLAALDGVVAAAQNAVRESPNDPLLNQYYLSSSGVRQATLQVLNRKLPNGAQLTGY